MEKLQAAVEKAQKRRLIWAEPANLARHGADIALAWQELPAFEPDVKKLARRRVAANTRGPARTAIDLLRTRLLKLMQQNGWKRVMITSPTPGCGKSTVTANLAMAMQRQTESRILLMDLDLPVASLGGILGLTPQHDVPDLLSGRVSPDEQMYRIGTNLAVSVSARGYPEHTEILKSSQAQRQIEELDSQFGPDIVLFDFPPLFSSDDAIAGARYADCALIVAAAGQTSITDIDTTERDLSQYTNVAGVILNKCRFMSKTSQFDYRY